MAHDKVAQETDSLRRNLRVFNRICNNLRNANPPNEEAISACQKEINLLRAKLSLPSPITNGITNTNFDNKGGFFGGDAA